MVECYHINFWELLGRCSCDGTWSASQKMQSCIINGMTDDILGSITNTIVDDGVTCADYIHGRLILNCGAIAMLNLRRLGYDHDICIAVQAEHGLHINSTKHVKENLLLS